MTVAVDQWTELDLILEIGSIAERVEVAAQSLQLNTVEASPGQVIENQRIVEMPLNGRYYGDLAAFSGHSSFGGRKPVQYFQFRRPEGTQKQLHSGRDR